MLACILLEIGTHIYFFEMCFQRFEAGHDFSIESVMHAPKLFRQIEMKILRGLCKLWTQ